MILGAILAGGAARRFGGDKAAALANGIAMLDRVAAALRPQCDTLVVVGRDWPGLPRIDDRPHAGLGPLGALAGALAHARAVGHDRVLTSGCDLPTIPADLAHLLHPAPAVIAGQPLLGLWRTDQLDTLLAYLAAGERRLGRWVEHGGARQIAAPFAIPNINTPDDLARYEAELRLTAADPRSSR